MLRSNMLPLHRLKGQKNLVCLGCCIDRPEIATARQVGPRNDQGLPQKLVAHTPFLSAENPFIFRQPCGIIITRTVGETDRAIVRREVV